MMSVKRGAPTGRAFAAVLVPWLLALPTGALIAMPAAAWAADCGVEQGKVILNDSFADGLSGWPEDKAASFGKSGLTLNLAGSDTSWNYVTTSFDAQNADYCLQLPVPTKVTDDNLTAAGLVFDFADEDDYYSLLLFSDGAVVLTRTAQGKDTKLFEQEETTPPLASGTPAVLRATVKDGLITVALNGTELKQVRAKMSGGPARFGVTAQRDQTAPGDTPLHFDRLRVTEVP